MARISRALVVALAVAGMTPFGCSKAGSVNESRPLTKDFDGYKTGAVEVDTAGLEGGGKGSQEFLAYLEKQLKTNGVLEPLSSGARNRSWEPVGLLDLVEGLEQGT